METLHSMVLNMKWRKLISALSHVAFSLFTEYLEGNFWIRLAFPLQKNKQASGNSNFVEVFVSNEHHFDSR